MEAHVFYRLLLLWFILILTFGFLSYYESRDYDYAVIALAGAGLLLCLWQLYHHGSFRDYSGYDVEDRSPGYLRRKGQQMSAMGDKDRDRFISDDMTFSTPIEML